MSRNGLKGINARRSNDREKRILEAFMALPKEERDAMLSKLPQRQALIYRLYHGIDRPSPLVYREISEMIGLEQGSVGINKRKAEEVVRHLIERRTGGTL